MKRFDYTALKRASKHSLSHSSQDPKRLVLIHSGVSLLLFLLLSVLTFLLDRQIGETGGLGGMDQRVLLTTVQTVLRFLYITLLPFWTIGYTFVTLQLSQQEPVSKESLLEGFRLFNPVLRLTFLTLILAGGILFFGYQAGYFLFCATPWAVPLLKVAAQMAQAGTPADFLALEPAFTAALQEVLLPLLCFVIPVCLLFAAPIFYRFRLARLHLMEYPEEGALRALFGSTRLMRGNYLAMFRLDLHYWWYHSLRLLLLVIGCGGIIVTVAKITLPIPADLFQLICSAVCVSGSAALAWWRKNEVCLAYAYAYGVLKDPPPEPEPALKNPPWTY